MLRSRAARIASAAISATVTLACAEEGPREPPSLPFEHASEHFEVHADIERCAGDLARWDGFTKFAAELLGTTAPTAQPMYVWESAFDGVGICGFATSGCYREREGIIYASAPTVEHEIVHVLTQDYEGPDAFFREGLAEALSGPTAFGRYAPSFPRSGSTQVDYASAGHFVRWVIETHGLDSILEQIGGDGSVATFEQIVGQPLEDMIETYFSEAPASYPALYRQPLPSFELLGDGLWSTEIELSCAREDVRATTDGLEAAREWTAATTGHYTFWTSTPARVRVRLVEGQSEASLGAGVTVQGQDLGTVALSAGVYEIDVLPPPGTTTTRLMVWANAAAIPVPPGAAP